MSDDDSLLSESGYALKARLGWKVDTRACSAVVVRFALLGVTRRCCITENCRIDCMCVNVTTIQRALGATKYSTTEAPILRCVTRLSPPPRGTTTLPPSISWAKRKVHYIASSGSTWGEHEIDYVFSIQADVDLDPNPNEVKKCDGRHQY